MMKEMFLQFLSDPQITFKVFHKSSETGIYVFYNSKVKINVTVDTPFYYDLFTLALLISREIIHVKMIVISEDS